MPPLLQFLLRRSAAVVATLLVITVFLYGLAMLYPPQTRAELYFSQNVGKHFIEENRYKLLDALAKQYGLYDPFPIQYGRWVINLVKGDWGFSGTNRVEVLPALKRLAPSTVELTLYSLFLFIPLGILAGVWAGIHKNEPRDFSFRATAFIATSLPPVVLAIVLMAVFYVMVHWFPPDRVGDITRLYMDSAAFKSYTGLITIDGLLNGRPDISLEALRHLVLPVITLSLFHWATLGRVTRGAVIEEMDKDYIRAARARGISEQKAIWRHAFRNALLPPLNTSAMAAASLISGVYVVETIFNFRGISSFMRNSIGTFTPDLPALLGFTIFSVIFVMLFMLALDLLQAMADPRFREGMGTR